MFVQFEAAADQSLDAVGRKSFTIKPAHIVDVLFLGVAWLFLEARFAFTW